MPSCLQPLDHVPGLAAGRRVEAGRRLVEEDQVGVADRARPRRRRAAAGRRTGSPTRASRFSAEPDELDRLVDRARARRRSPRTASPSRARSASGRARTPAGRGRCARARRASACRGRRRAPLTSPPVRLPVALEDLDRRRLAGAVRAEEAEHLAGATSKLDARARPRGRRRTCAARRPRSLPQPSASKASDLRLKFQSSRSRSSRECSSRRCTSRGPPPSISPTVPGHQPLSAAVAPRTPGECTQLPGVEEARRFRREPLRLAIARPTSVRVAEHHPFGVDPKPFDDLAHRDHPGARDRARREVG